VVAITPLGGTSLTVTTRLVVIGGLTDTAGKLLSLSATFGRSPEADVAASDFIDTEWGFWAALGMLLLVTVTAGSSWARARREAWARELRAPDSN
jgi:hypothetical protein